MSAALVIILDNDNPGFDTMVHGKFLSQDSENLERIASSLGIRPLEDYVSYSPEEAQAMLEDLGTAVETIEATELPEQRWYDPQEGLDLVAQLVNHIRSNPSSVTNANGILTDLHEYQEVFEKSKTIGARWHLQVDF